MLVSDPQKKKRDIFQGHWPPLESCHFPPSSTTCRISICPATMSSIDQTAMQPQDTLCGLLWEKYQTTDIGRSTADRLKERSHTKKM